MKTFVLISGLSNSAIGIFFAIAFTVSALLTSSGCATQKGKIVDPNSADRIGSHRAGSEIYDPAAQAAVNGLLEQAARTPVVLEDSGKTVAQIAEDYGVRRICFVGVENAGGEEMGDLRENLSESIRTMITQSEQFDVVDSRLVSAGLRDTGLRVDDLLLPDKRSKFAAALGELDAPFDYLLFAKVTTATTRDNVDSQVKYSLTLDLVNVHTGASLRETVELKKHYNRSALAKIKDVF